MMPVLSSSPTPHSTLRLALGGLRTWTGRNVLTAITAGTGVALLIGIATVLIPNPIFSREIPPVWWNYPVWLLTSALSGMLVGTYVRGPGTEAEDSASGGGDSRSNRFGLLGGFLAWFAVGCPVCNKIALLVLGYSGAITWFAPVQPFLALVALVFTAVALVWRLKGQVSCSIPSRR